MVPSWVFLSVGAFLLHVGVSRGARVLLLTPFGAPSHTALLRVLARGLSGNHHVTLVSSDRACPRSSGTTEFCLGTPLEPGFTGNAERLWKILPDAIRACKIALPIVDAILSRDSHDLAVLDAFWSDCHLPLLFQHDVPVILFGTGGFYPNYYQLGLHQPTSFCPVIALPFSDRMPFWQRTVNTLAELGYNLFYDRYLLRKMNAALQEFRPGIPSIESARINVTLVLVNHVIGCDDPRPLTPDFVPVGPLHVRNPDPLRPELEDYVQSSGEHGFIYFSLGSAVQGKFMPEKYRKMFIEAFAKFPQKILWKWETEHMDDLPKNVKLSKWLPQQDLLGHPKLRLFITHGGLLSTQEATYHGVPVVGIPIGADQMLNMKKTELEGAGLTLEWVSLTPEKIYQTIKRVMDEPSFRENLKRRSAIMRDQPETPLERAVFWTEYVIRHKGAPHLRSAARDLTWYQYHLIDVWAFILGVIGAVLALAFFLLRWCWRCACRKGSGKPQQQGKGKRKKE